jgi:hypothetical protein
VHVQVEGLIAGHLEQLAGAQAGSLAHVHKQQRHLLAKVRQNLISTQNESSLFSIKWTSKIKANQCTKKQRISLKI